MRNGWRNPHRIAKSLPCCDVDSENDSESMVVVHLRSAVQVYTRTHVGIDLQPHYVR